MSDNSRPSELSPKDPVRIVYHTENRTFARLFNERSLEEVKDVVRRKLGLGQGTGVSLKQMGSGSDVLLDLEDDDDFQAFRVLLRSSVAVDIQVTVGKSQGPTVPLPSVAPVSQLAPSLGDVLKQRLSQQPREQPSAGKPTSKSGVIPSAQPSARPEVSRTTETSPTPGKPRRMAQKSALIPAKALVDPSARKRKVSFDDSDNAPSDKPTEGQTPVKAIAVTPVASAKTVESSAAPKPADTEERPKKKQKKESTANKDTQSTEAAESPAIKVPATKPKKKSTTLDSGSKAGTSAQKVVESSEPQVKKQRKLKRDDLVPKKSSALDGTGQQISKPSNPVNEASLQPGSSVEVGTSQSKSETTTEVIGVCASIPQTSASTSVRSEVAATILSVYLSKANEAVPPPAPPAKRKYVRRDTKKSSASSSALLAEPATVLDAPANETSNAPTEHRLEQVVLTSEPPQQTSNLNGPPCPICLEEPFHIRYFCPTVLKGPDAIRERLEELKRTNMGDRRSLIKELEGLLRDSKVTSEPTNAGPTGGVQSSSVSPSNVSLPRTPTIPSNSRLSEVTVESRDEGSSSESSDDMSEGGVNHQELSTSRRQKTPDEQPLPSDGDLEAVIRGPTSKQQSVLHLLDRFTEDEDDKDSDSGEDGADLEEDVDEEIGRSRRPPCRRVTRSSDSESEEEESRSPSPSRSVEATSHSVGSGVQAPTQIAEESAEHQAANAIMRNVDPPVLDDDSSEETHVGSEDQMVVDRSIEEKRASVLQPSDALSTGPQEPAETEVEPASSRHGSAPITSGVLKEVEADPIEPADDLVPPTVSGSSNADPIEAPPEDITSLFSNTTQSTPKPGVSKRIKTRNGQIPDDEADCPVLLEQLASEVTKVTPMPTKGKSRRKVTETPANQELASKRRSPRFSSLPSSTPVATMLLSHRSKSGARTGKAAKTPAKRSEECSDASKNSAKDDATQNGARIAPAPSLNRWETLAEPSSPSLQLDEPPLFDELMSSSPHPEDIAVRGHLNDKEKKGRPYKPATSSQEGNSQRKERLFDLSSSQIPFPYSQYQTTPAASALPNGKVGERTTDSEDSEDEPKVAKKWAKTPVQYRPLSQLTSQTTLFSPSLPTPANKSVTNGKTKKRATDDDSSSSSSSDADEVNGSGHIPRGRRAGSVLETKKRRSLLSRF